MKTQTYIKEPKVTLLGAGPGDPELLTVKGALALQAADAVLYDALIHPNILRYVAPHAEQLFVGKRAGDHTYDQEDINQLIVQYAHKYGNVVRLKGGDPFIFGRGQEEVEFARNFGVEVAVIPGLSSSTSLATSQGIPLTTRGVADSFWVLTGVTKEGKLSQDLQFAARSNATVVVLMGRRKLWEITELYKREGKADLPVAVIQNGTLPTENVAIGNVSTILELAEEKELGTPAVIVLGEVVKFHPSYVYEYVQQHLNHNTFLN